MSVTYHPTVVQEITSSDGSLTITVSNGGGSVDLVVVDSAVTLGWDDVLVNKAISGGTDPQISFGDQITFLGSAHGNVDLRLSETNGGEFHIEMDGDTSPVIIFSNTDTPGVNFEVRGNDIKFGRTTVGNDTVLSFVSNANTGVITWDQSEDEFILSDDLVINTGETLQISDITAGSVLFATTSGVLSQNNSGFFWDEATNRLGLGNNTPSDRLHVTGRARIDTSSTTAFQVMDGTTIFNVDTSTPLVTVTAPLTVTGVTTFNTVAYTWPASDGTGGFVLSTDGAGALSWVDNSATVTWADTLANGNQSGANNVILDSPQVLTSNGTIEIANGSAAAPSFRLTNSSTTGLYRPAANQLGITASGVQQGVFTGRSIRINGQSSALAPAYSFVADTTSGMYRPAASQLGFSVAGTSTAVMVSQQLRLNGGSSVSAPAYSFTAATNTGMYRPASSQLGFSVGGVQQGFFTSRQFRINGQSLASTPAYSFVAETNTGMYRIGASNLGFSIAGTNRLDVNATRTNIVNALVVGSTTTFNTVSYTWPGADGTSGFVLSTNGAGTLSWVTNSGSNSFETISTPLGTSPVADSATDTLTLTNSDTYIDITGTAATDTIDFTLDVAGLNAALDHGTLAGLADDDHTQYLNETRHDALAADNPHSVTFAQVLAAANTSSGNDAQMTTTDEIQFRATTNRIYSSATDTLDVEGNATTNIGKDGDIILGVGNAISMKPDTTGTVDLGTGSLAFNDAWFSGTMNLTAGALRLEVDTSDVADPPTDANLDSAFGTPATVGSGFVAFLDDNNADTDFWLVASNGTSWYYMQMTKAV